MSEYFLVTWLVQVIPIKGRTKLYSIIKEKLCQVWCFTPVIQASWEARTAGSRSKANPGKMVRPYLKNKVKRKRTGGMAQMVVRLSSVPSTAKINKKPFLSF
jgi:hypothetical protein